MFSIVIPTYNRDDDLKQALISIRNNTTLPFEIIVLHSGIDSTSRICEKYGAISVFDNARKNGKRVKSLWAIINYGIRLAKYDYVLYLNDDCVVLKDWDLVAKKYFDDCDNLGLLVLKTKGIGNVPDFRVNNIYFFNVPCANYAIINKKANVFFDEKYSWYYGDSDIPMRFITESNFVVGKTEENMVIHNHRIDENRKINDSQLTKNLKDTYRFFFKWSTYREENNIIKKGNFIFRLKNFIYFKEKYYFRLYGIKRYLFYKFLGIFFYILLRLLNFSNEKVHLVYDN